MLAQYKEDNIAMWRYLLLRFENPGSCNQTYMQPTDIGLESRRYYLEGWAIRDISLFDQQQ